MGDEFPKIRSYRPYLVDLIDKDYTDRKSMIDSINKGISEGASSDEPSRWPSDLADSYKTGILMKRLAPETAPQKMERLSKDSFGGGTLGKTILKNLRPSSIEFSPYLVAPQITSTAAHEIGHALLRTEDESDYEDAPDIRLTKDVTWNSPMIRLMRARLTNRYLRDPRSSGHIKPDSVMLQAWENKKVPHEFGAELLTEYADPTNTMPEEEKQYVRGLFDLKARNVLKKKKVEIE